jgi:type III secretory pathway component EscU
MLSPTIAGEDHTGMVQNALDELPVCGEAGIVPIVDVARLDLIASLIGTLTIAASLDIVPGRQQFMSDMAVRRDPQANLGIGSIAHFASPVC